MKLKYAYYPGCSLHSTAVDYDESSRITASTLGIELVEIPNWTCCGASPGHVTDNVLAHSLPIKNLLLAEKISNEMAVVCAACFSRFKFAEKSMRDDPKVRDEIKEVLDLKKIPDVKTRHFLDILINEYGLEEIKKKVKQELKGLKVASYYGCLLIRPPEIVEFDDPEEPTSLDDLVTALGAEAISWPYKNECCGGSFAIGRTDIVLKLTHDILQDAQDASADCIVVACPLCQANLELRQGDINKKFKKKFHLPIFYFTQLLGLALGIKKRKLGLQRAMVSNQSLLKKKGIK